MTPQLFNSEVATITTFYKQTADGADYNKLQFIYTTKHGEIRRYATADLSEMGGFIGSKRGEDLDVFGEGLHLTDVFASEEKAWLDLLSTLESAKRHDEISLELSSKFLEEKLLEYLELYPAKKAA